MRKIIIISALLAVTPLISIGDQERRSPSVHDLTLPQSYGPSNAVSIPEFFEPGMNGPAYEFAKFQLSSSNASPILTLTYGILNTNNEPPSQYVKGLQQVYAESKSESENHFTRKLDGYFCLFVVGDPEPFEDSASATSLAYVPLHGRLYRLTFEKFGSPENVKPYPLEKAYISNLAWAFVTLNK